MHIYDYNNAPLTAGDVIFRQHRWPFVMGMVICLVFPLTGWLVYQNGDHVPGIVIGGGSSLLTLLYLTRTREFFSSRNWLLRFNSQQVMIQIAPIGSRDPERCFVLALEKNEIEWFRPYAYSSTYEGSDGPEVVAANYLDIQLRTQDTAEIATHIAKASTPRIWCGFHAAINVPVRLLDGPMIRLVWVSKSPESFMKPGLKKTARLLAEHYPVLAKVVDQNSTGQATEKQKAMEDQIVQLIQTGETIQAIKLARKRYGFSLTDAKQFVDELRNPTPPAQNR